MTSTGTAKEHLFSEMLLRNKSSCVVMRTLLKYVQGTKSIEYFSFIE